MTLRILAFVLVLAALSSYAASPSKISSEGFVYLRADEVNLRSGPDARHPVKWVIKSRGEPMKVLEKFYQWLRVQNINGYEGWIQMPMTGRRKYAIVISNNKKPITAHATNSVKSRKIVRLEHGVRVGVSKCNESGWCKISIEGFKAWIDKKNLWGV